ncbi:hypothetical protein RSOLAG1IB_11939 [Rhizoctonia solani AG-1 IB]|uniref:Uncharacterized protein n=1 Tax=Thanatephorus cucumeris (strain AG1-IB / isolate 7/3/14) TaxID=1108050 RepID=A0A0B7FJX2_THACB|nr:hypothetical protein RSOLAG1IB_11939 [Rhizoctonia solani AG-1 IB]
MPAVSQFPDPAKVEGWRHVLGFLVGNKSQLFMPKLEAETFDSVSIDRVFRRLASAVQVRFPESQGSEFTNHIQAQL